MGVIIIYVISAFMRPDIMGQAFAFAAKIFRNLVPVLFLIFALIFIADLFLNTKWIKRYLGKDTGVSSWLIAVVGGVLSTGPVYAWYPFLQELREKGMRSSLVAVFLYSRSVKLPLLPLMVHYFGAIYTLILCLYLIGFSILNGILIDKLVERRGIANS